MLLTKYAEACSSIGCKENSHVMKTLEYAAKDTAGLKKLDIGDALVGVKGVLAVAELLKWCEGIEEVILSRSDMRDKGIQEICRVLERRPHVKVLDISGNPDVTGEDYLLKLVKKSSSLESLVTTGSGVPSDTRNLLVHHLDVKRKEKIRQAGLVPLSDLERTAPANQNTLSVILQKSGMTSGVCNSNISDGLIPYFERHGTHFVHNTQHGEIRVQEFVEAPIKILSSRPVDILRYAVSTEARIFATVFARVPPGILHSLVSPSCYTPTGCYTIAMHQSASPCYIPVSDYLDRFSFTPDLPCLWPRLACKALSSVYSWARPWEPFAAVTNGWPVSWNFYHNDYDAAFWKVLTECFALKATAFANPTQEAGCVWIVEKAEETFGLRLLVVSWDNGEGPGRQDEDNIPKHVLKEMCLGCRTSRNSAVIHYETLASACRDIGIVVSPTEASSTVVGQLATPNDSRGCYEVEVPVGVSRVGFGVAMDAVHPISIVVSSVPPASSFSDTIVATSEVYDTEQLFYSAKLLPGTYYLRISDCMPPAPEGTCKLTSFNCTLRDVSSVSHWYTTSVNYNAKWTTGEHNRFLGDAPQFNMVLGAFGKIHVELHVEVECTVGFKPYVCVGLERVLGGGEEGCYGRCAGSFGLQGGNVIHFETQLPLGEYCIVLDPVLEGVCVESVKCVVHAVAGPVKLTVLRPLKTQCLQTKSTPRSRPTFQLISHSKFAKPIPMLLEASVPAASSTLELLLSYSEPPSLDLLHSEQMWQRVTMTYMPQADFTDGTPLWVQVLHNPPGASVDCTFKVHTEPGYEVLCQVVET